jgi:hypothetical protein
MVGVDEATSVFVTVTGKTLVTPGMTVVVKGRVRMTGVAVTMIGVREGISVCTESG